MENLERVFELTFARELEKPTTARRHNLSRPSVIMTANEKRGITMVSRHSVEKISQTLFEADPMDTCCR